MKKLLALLMALIFVFSFAACSSEDKKDDKKETTTVNSTTAQKAPENTDEPSDVPAKVDVAVYNEVLEKYRATKKDYDDNGVIDGAVDYNLAASDTLFGNDLQYLFEEITGDETQELIVATKGADAESVNILNIWTVRNGKAEPLFKDTAFGYNAMVIPCASMTALVSSHSGAFSLVYNAYDIDYSLSEPTFRGAIGTYTNPTTNEVTYKMFDTPVDAGAVEDDTIGEVVTQAEYDAFFSEYCVMAPELFTWTSL